MLLENGFRKEVLFLKSLVAGGVKIDYCSTFDLKKPVERSLLTSGNIECVNLQIDTTLVQLQDKCKSFCSRLSR